MFTSTADARAETRTQTLELIPINLIQNLRCLFYYKKKYN